MKKTLIKNAIIINERNQIKKDVLICGEFIERIDKDISHPSAQVIDDEKLHMLPGLIDDQVHFREPGLTHKADIQTESKAAVAGGITSFMEMPNTNPPTLTQELLQEKYDLAAKCSLANYAFYMGASNGNLTEVLQTDPRQVPGIKVFMGSSTGKMLVNDEKTLENIFSKVRMLIATHCEDEKTISENLARYRNLYGENILPEMHSHIRSSDACYLSSSKAVALAKTHNTRLHVLHISSAKECELFETIPLADKRITAEACVHHLWFTDQDYNETKGNHIKWNPAIKTPQDQKAIWQALHDGRIDVIATDHAPHTLAEKENPYLTAPAGGPLVQHALLALLECHKQGKISLKQIVQKTAHNVATCFNIEKRGFIKEGYYADLVLVDLNKPQTVTTESLLYKCGWSPFLNQTFSTSIAYTFVNGHKAFDSIEEVCEAKSGMALRFKPQTA